MLLEREELRDRMLWLIGAQDLTLTTHAVDDAMQRVSRYLGMQSLICGIHGLAVGIGLAVIGVPGAVLWGALSAVLRFLPYFGPWLAAAGPIALALAAFPGWSAPLLTVALFVILELVSNNVLEPWLYGASAGLSPFGVVFSAVFWAWLWGIPGLLIATPLTVCLVVAGRYVRGLEYFTVLLGDRPALLPDVRLYQRLLALDLGGRRGGAGQGGCRGKSRGGLRRRRAARAAAPRRRRSARPGAGPRECRSPRAARGAARRAAGEERRGAFPRTGLACSSCRPSTRTMRSRRAGWPSSRPRAACAARSPRRTSW